jgi:hypothetical protein
MNRAMELVGTELELMSAKTRKAPLPKAQALALASYLRALSAVRRDRKGRPLAGKSVAELMEMARQDPELMDLLGGA